MARITLVGSGAAGVHFALSALKKGHQVTMLDVGYTGPLPVNPGHSFVRLKCSLKDPVQYFLGEKFESVVSPENDKEIYGFPPNKQYVFTVPPGFKEHASGFEPLFSFAAGGLAQAWTGGSYPFNDEELKGFPFDYAAIEPYYAEVAQRIGIIGTQDDLSTYYPMHKNLLPPMQFDTHSQLLVDRYQKKRDKVLKKYGVSLGRSRVAVLSRDHNGRPACDLSGRCIWGCPTQSLYVPSITLEQCRAFPAFTYLPHHWVSHFKYDAQQRITHVVASRPGQNTQHEFPVQLLVLAAGTLSTSKIYLDSIFQNTGKVHQLHGLMDNRQVLVPFINLGMLSKEFNPDSYQYHQLAIGFKWGENQEYIHGQVTTLKTALMQPVFQTMPLDWHTATFLGRNLHAALGVINMNYSDTRREGNFISISHTAGADTIPSTLEISYTPPAGEKKKLAETIKHVKKFFANLGVVVPPGQAHMRPMGASVHYSGTLPMSVEAEPHTLSPTCKSHSFENLYVVDGAAFPSLPAKNLTFSLMANAARVADSIPV